MDYVTLKDVLMFVGLCISNIGTWFISRRKQNNDFLAELQKSIDLLTEKYTKALDENVTLKEDNANLRSDNAQLLAIKRELADKIDKLTKKVDSLTKQLKNYEKNNQGISTYTTAIAHSTLPDGVRLDQGSNDLEVRSDDRGSAGGRKCRNSGRNRTRRAAFRTPSGGDSTDDNEVGGHGGGTCTDELTDGADSEPP